MLSIKDPVRPKHVRPPVSDARRSRQRMTHHDRIVACSVEAAINSVPQSHGLQLLAGCKLKWLCAGDITFVFNSRIQPCAHRQPRQFYRKRGVNDLLSNQKKPSALKVARKALKLSLSPIQLFSSFLRGASRCKSPRSVVKIPKAV